MSISGFFERMMRIRNPHFALSENITTYVFISFILHLICCKIRGVLYPLLKGRLQFCLFLESSVSLRFIHNIKFGKYCLIEKGCILSAPVSDSLTIGDGSKISAYSSIHVSKNFQNLTGFIRIGKGVGIGEYANLGGAGGLTIGNDCIVGAYFSCHPENHNFSDHDQLIKHQGVTHKGIKIGDNCWIGAKVTILDGAQVGNGCVIAAGAVVKDIFPDHSLIAGVPAKLIRKIE